MDLEVVGRHALLFDDDANAAFVNSGDALVEWNSLQIDRYDVRHLLSAPPPSRRRCRNPAIEPVVLKDLSLESQLDHERYLDLPSNDDLPDAEHGKHQTGAGYSAVGFSYGSTDDSSYPKNTDTGVEASGFIPHFPVPDNLLHGLPPTEKLHQIIARTAMFVSKHGGQSEIILRVKQEGNPMFGFLMPGHQLHAYFRYLLEHPEFLNPASDGIPQVDGKEAGNQSLSSDIGGALSLLGSVYGSGEDDEGHEIEINTKDISHGFNSSGGHNLSPVSKNILSQTDVGKDESVSRNHVPSNKDGVLTAKKNPSMIAAKSKSVKGVEGESYSVYDKANKVKRASIGMKSKIAPVILDPPPAIKRWVEKLIDFIMVNEKLFDATLEQDCVRERLSFLVPSDKYHSYYLKALETARESKGNDKGLSRSAKGKEGESSLVSVDADKVKRTTSGITSKIDPVILEPPADVKRLIYKLIKFIMVNGKLFEATFEQDCMLQNFLLQSDKYHPYYLKSLERARESKLNSKDLCREMDDPSGRRVAKQASVLKEKNSAFCDLAWESDKKEKFKMVIGGSKKETQEAESKAAHEDYGIPVDAAAAAAILHAATRGIKQSILQPNSSTSSTHIHVSSEGRHPENLGNLLPPQGENTGAKDRTESPNGSDVRTVAVELGSDAHSSDTHLTKEQKLKAERLKKAKMFVAKLKSGDVPVKTETLRGPSLEPPEPGIVRLDVDGKERGGIIMTPMDIDGLATGEKLDRNYFGEEHYRRLLKRKYRSRSGRGDNGEDDGDLMGHDKPCSRSKEHGKDLISSSEDGESSEEDRDHKCYRSKHQSRHSIREDKHDDKPKKDKNHKRSRKKHNSDSSPHRHSRRHRSSKKHLQEDAHDYDDRERGHSRRKHHSHHSSHHGRDKYGHVNEHPFRDDESRSNHKRGSSSGDECSNQGSLDKHRKMMYSERNELEEGEISSRKSEESRGISIGHGGREASVDVVSSCQRAQSQTSETTTEVPDDFRAKIRAMLMATHL